MARIVSHRQIVMAKEGKTVRKLAKRIEQLEQRVRWLELQLEQTEVKEVERVHSGSDTIAISGTKTVQKAAKKRSTDDKDGERSSV